MRVHPQGLVSGTAKDQARIIGHPNSVLGENITSTCQSFNSNEAEGIHCSSFS